MNIQSTLTNKGPMILDATCSFSKIWPKTASIRIDIRPECNPDIVMDAKDLKFEDNYFDEIYCDPPHLIRKGDNLEGSIRNTKLSGRLKSSNMFVRFGYWHNHEEFYEFVDKTNNEFHRVLKPGGIVHYKMTDGTGCVRTSDLIERMNKFIVIKDEKTKSKSVLGKANARWLTFQSRKTKEKEGQP